MRKGAGGGRGGGPDDTIARANGEGGGGGGLHTHTHRREVRGGGRGGHITAKPINAFHPLPVRLFLQALGAQCALRVGHFKRLREEKGGERCEMQKTNWGVGGGDHTGTSALA